MSNVWDKYKSTVRTHISVPEGRTLITENQWKAKHFIKVDEQSGKYLWVNANCPFKKLYLWDEEVRHMTEQELAKYQADEKSKRIAQRKALLKCKEAKKQEELQLFKKEITQNIIKKTFSVPYMTMSCYRYQSLMVRATLFSTAILSRFIQIIGIKLWRLIT